MTARAKSPHAKAVERIVRREYRYENGDGARALRASILRLVARVEREARKEAANTLRNEVVGFIGHDWREYLCATIMKNGARRK